MINVTDWLIRMIYRAGNNIQGFIDTFSQKLLVALIYGRDGFTTIYRPMSYPPRLLDLE